MKLASLRNGRDGRLVVVSDTLQRWLPVDGYATLQAALDDWANAAPVLEAIAERVNGGEGDAFDETACASPLPRARA